MSRSFERDVSFLDYQCSEMHCIEQLKRCHKDSSFLILGLPCRTTLPGQGSSNLAFLSAPAPYLSTTVLLLPSLYIRPTPMSEQQSVLWTRIFHVSNKAFNSHTSVIDNLTHS